MQQVATADSTARTTRPYFFAKAIEATWLVAAFLVPVIVMDEDAMVGFIQMPKVFVLRTTGLVLISLIIFEWALTANLDRRTGLDLRGVWHRSFVALRSHPGRVVYWAASAVLGATLISWAFSPVKSIGFFGIDPGWDTYGLFNVSFYLAFFLVVGARMRTRHQVERLIWTLTAASIAFSVYGVLQHFGVDPLVNDPVPVERAGLTFGNPIFGAAVLLMTIPLTIAVFMPYQDRMTPLAHALLGGALITFQLTAFTFTQSRGPLVALAVALVAYGIAIAWVRGAAALKRPGAILGVAILLTVGFNVIPVADAPENTRSFGDAVGSIAPDVTGGLNNRYVIWRTAGIVYLNVPWLDTDQYDEVPDLSFRWLRPIVGYGPDMFGYAYPMAGDTEYTKDLASHGHNFIVHTAVELGALGVLAYVFLFGATGYLLLLMLKAAKRGETPEWMTFVILALVWVLIGRAVEQIPGKAQVADLHLMWVLIGLVVALFTMHSRRLESPSMMNPPRGAATQRRRVRTNRRDPVASPGMATLSLPRVVLAGSIAVLALFVWFTTIANQVAAAAVNRDGTEAQARGQFDRARDLFAESIDQAPDAPGHRISMGQLLFAAATQQDQQRQNRIQWLEEAIAIVEAIIDRNPLDQRAWSRLSEYERELAVLEPARTDRALHASRLLVDLMPGFWQARTGLAWAYVRLGFYEEALRTVQDAKETRALESAGANLIYYIQAEALAGLGRTDEALAAAHCSLGYQVTQQVLDFLRARGETVGDTYDFTEEDFAICPELSAA